MSKQLFGVGLGLHLDDSISFIHGSGNPGDTAGLPDLVVMGSLYSNDDDGTLWRKSVSGEGSGCWIKIPDSSGGSSENVLSKLKSLYLAWA